MKQITLKIEGGLEENQIGYETQQRLVFLFEECLQLQQKKASTYGEAWRDQGWAGNVGRVLSKAARLKNMVWQDHPVESATEPVTETLMDMINLAAFAIFNYNDRNRWGNARER